MKSSNTVFHIFTAVIMKCSVFFACWLLQTGLLFGLFLETGNGGDISLSNFGRLPPDYTALYARRQNSSVVILFEKLAETTFPHFSSSSKFP
jgi:hypothetical protein